MNQKNTNLVFYAIFGDELGGGFFYKTGYDLDSLLDLFSGERYVSVESHGSFDLKNICEAESILNDICSNSVGNERYEKTKLLEKL
jgi:hypothetical protein